MTADWREVAICPQCGTEVSTEPKWKAWIRTHPELDSIRHCVNVVDTDVWVHRYGRRTRGKTDRSVMYLMSVEVKSHDRSLTEPQREVLHIVNQLLRTKALREVREAGRLVKGHAQNVRNVFASMAGRRVLLHCYGVHVLRMSGATPNDSDRMTWDNRDIDAKELIELLRFDRNPDDPRHLVEHRSHKRMINDPPGLFDVVDGT
jgi:hypothetical protein